MADPRYPRSERTIYPRHHTPPLQGERLKKAKEAEAVRAKHDPYYITADQARELPQEAVDAQPELRSRIEYSRRDWPESRAVLSVALGPLEGGQGETTQKQEVDAASLFSGRRVGEGE